MNDGYKLIAAGLLAIIIAALGLAVCYMWGVESDPCAIDTPMEQAHCRAMGPRTKAERMWK